MYDLKRRRKELGLTLEEVGNFVGVGKSTVRKWENGDINNIGRSNIAKLANALKISPLHIIKDDYDGSVNNIEVIYNQLNNDRQKKVYDFADLQLKQQNGELEQNHILIAAHSKEDLTDDERQQINDFIDKIRKEKKKVGG